MNNWNLELIDIRPSVLLLIKNVLINIENKYGLNSSNYLAYHDVYHTLDVVESMDSLCQKAIKLNKITPKVRELLLVAAAYHDYEHNKATENEIISANKSIEDLNKLNEFSVNDIELVKSAILATKVNFDNSGNMTQSATNEYTTQLLADADLASLGKPTEFFVSRIKLYFEEINKKHASQTWVEFINHEISFLNYHKFYTEQANILFPHKNENLKYLTDQLH